MTAAIAVVVVTHDSAGHVGDTLGALVPPAARRRRADRRRQRLSRPHGRGGAAAAPRAWIVEQDNRGFAGGAVAGAAVAAAPLLVFLNPDAQPAVGCLDELRRVADERPGWGAWRALVTMEGGTTINTAGDVTHFLGMGWAGRCGQPVAEAPREPVEVSFASGAALAVRGEAWERTGGFDERYLMYCEDLDLCLRLWLAGWAVGIAPAARVEHDYDFEKGGRKWFLLERNRWWTILADYPGWLLLLAPALLAAEVALMGVAARGGWLRQKLRAQGAVVAALPGHAGPAPGDPGDPHDWRRRLRPAAYRQRRQPLPGTARRDRPLAAAQRAYWALVVRLLEAAPGFRHEQQQ